MASCRLGLGWSRSEPSPRLSLSAPTSRRRVSCILGRGWMTSEASPSLCLATPDSLRMALCKPERVWISSEAPPRLSLAAPGSPRRDPCLLKRAWMRSEASSRFWAGMALASSSSSLLPISSFALLSWRRWPTEARSFLSAQANSLISRRSFPEGEEPTCDGLTRRLRGEGLARRSPLWMARKQQRLTPACRSLISELCLLRSSSRLLAFSFSGTSLVLTGTDGEPWVGSEGQSVPFSGNDQPPLLLRMPPPRPLHAPLTLAFSMGQKLQRT
mmetsp:Transcript_32312/g.89254  ORF Transcript_32312/g.89254 Transcript_32312/m.89254 type:complete len:272 (+) Transcript_32312:1482-2297(+)